MLVPRAMPGRAPVANIPSVGGGQDGSARAMAQVAQALGGFADVLNDHLDQAAIKAGQQDGSQAGLGPDLKLSGANTLYGDAYNAAALRTAEARMDVQLRADLDGIYQANRDDPAALSQSLDVARAGQAEKLLPELKPAHQLTFERLKAGYLMEAQERQRDRLVDEQRAALLPQLDARLAEVDRIGFTMRDPKTGALAYASAREEMFNLLVQHGPRSAFTLNGRQLPADPNRSGVLSLTDIAAKLDDADDRVQVGKLEGGLSRLTSSQAAVAFRDSFVRDYVEGKQPLPLRMVEQMKGRIEQRINSLEADERAAAVEVRRQASDLFEQMQLGYAVDNRQFDAVTQALRAQGDKGDAFKLNHARRALIEEPRLLRAYGERLRGMTPKQLDGEVQRLGSKTVRSTHEDARLEMALGLSAESSRMLETAPLEFAARKGVVALAPVSLTDAGSFARRAAAAERASAHFDGRRVPLLTKAEVTDLKGQLANAPADQKLVMIRNIASGGGRYGRALLGQLSREAPLHAHLGGLMLATPQGEQTARLALAGEEVWRLNKADLPKPKDFDRSMLGRAASLLPESRSAILETARAIYGARALQRGLEADRVDDSEWSRSLHLAAGGGWNAAGAPVGGLGTRNGVELLLPPTMTQQTFSDALAGLSDEALPLMGAGGGRPVDAAGRPLTASALRRDLVLYDAGPGLYRLGTKSGTEFVGDGQGGFFVLDMNKVAARRDPKGGRGGGR
jgi:hypothetical protein